jgi:hypothetical protein
MKQFDVFIGYSHRDKAVGDAICAALEAAGIQCWLAPRNILPDAEWSKSIWEAIQNARAMVLIFSQNANISSQIQKEVVAASDIGIPILPIRIQDVAPAASFSYYLSTVHWLDAFPPPVETHLDRVVDATRAMLGGTRPDLRGKDQQIADLTETQQPTSSPLNPVPPSAQSYPRTSLSIGSIASLWTTR